MAEDRRVDKGLILIVIIGLVLGGVWAETAEVAGAAAFLFGMAGSLIGLLVAPTLILQIRRIL